jgi:uncharacterized protein YgbK (DUF1537 family)
MTNYQQIEFLIGHADRRIAAAEKDLARSIEGMAREAAQAAEWVSEKRGSIESFASNCSMRAMEMMKASAELDQQRALRQQMVTMLEMIPA